MAAGTPRARFNRPDKGGQPKDFPLGIMKFPAVPGAACNECRSIAIGGSYVANAATKHPKEVLAFLNTFVSFEMVATAGLDMCRCRPASRATRPSSIAGRWRPTHFKMIEKANAGAKYSLRHPDPGAGRKPKECSSR